MKFANLSKVVGASALALSLSVLPATLPASAQTNTVPGTTDNAPGTVVDDDRDEDNDFDWGWLGLLGLLGLAGLAGRKRQEPTAYRDPNTTVSSTGYRE